MDAPLFRTKNNLKVEASLFADRLQVKNLGFNPLNKSDQIKLENIKRVNFIAPGPGEDPRRVSLAIEKEDEHPYVITGLNTTEAYTLKEEIERLKTVPPKDDSLGHPFTLAGRASKSIAQKKNPVSFKTRQFSAPLRRFGRNFLS